MEEDASDCVGVVEFITSAVVADVVVVVVVAVVATVVVLVVGGATQLEYNSTPPAVVWPP